MAVDVKVTIGESVLRDAVGASHSPEGSDASERVASAARSVLGEEALAAAWAAGAAMDLDQAVAYATEEARSI